MHVYAQNNPRMQTPTHLRINSPTYIHMYTRTYIHTYTRTQIHTYTCICFDLTKRGVWGNRHRPDSSSNRSGYSWVCHLTHGGDNMTPPTLADDAAPPVAPDVYYTLETCNPDMYYTIKNMQYINHSSAVPLIDISRKRSQTTNLRSESAFYAFLHGPPPHLSHPPTLQNSRLLIRESGPTRKYRR